LTQTCRLLRCLRRLLSLMLLHRLPELHNPLLYHLHELH
jgi:hypothetical protein